MQAAADNRQNNKYKGLLITLEGIEGSGKTSHIKAITAFLSAQGLKTVVTREPGGTPVAERIRELLLAGDDEQETLTPQTETLLFYAARSQHINHFIKPNLAQGVAVISDRFVDSSYAYQQAGRTIDLLHLDYLTSWIVADCLPDISFIFDLPVEQAMQRIRNRPLDRIEREHISFHQRVRQAYLDRAREQPGYYCIINAAQHQDKVKADIIHQLNLYLQARYVLA